jgi:hypothetical protein
MTLEVCWTAAFGHFLLGSHYFMVTALGSCVKWPLSKVESTLLKHSKPMQHATNNRLGNWSDSKLTVYYYSQIVIKWIYVHLLVLCVFELLVGCEGSMPRSSPLSPHILPPLFMTSYVSRFLSFRFNEDSTNHDMISCWNPHLSMRFLTSTSFFLYLLGDKRSTRQRQSTWGSRPLGRFFM